MTAKELINAMLESGWQISVQAYVDGTALGIDTETLRDAEQLYEHLSDDNTS